MKRVLISLVGVLLVATAVQAAPAEAGASLSLKPSVELLGVGSLFVPKDDDNYDGGASMEIQVRCWLTPYVGAALAMGSTTWAINDQDTTYSEGGVTGHATLDGAVNGAPIGVSLLLRPIRTGRFALTLEAGVRYVIVDSQADYEIEAIGPGGRVYVSDTLDIEDGVVGIAAATLEYKLTDQVFLLAGAGYQFDLEKGDVTILDDTVFEEQDLGENEFEALVFQAGLGVRF